jgi:hypothetical protein
MVTMVCLLKRRAGMSRDEFREYYEERHAPLGLSYIPSEIVANQRRYLEPFTNPTDSDSEAVEDFDVITELSFESRDQLEAAMQRLADPEAAEIMGKDEMNLFDRPATRVFIVDATCTSAIPPASG